ncbi:hypothetical protein GCM10010104_68580 [Streptomyces indiaensis]|uniref:Uncharacterized protein n=1 Tax=Streptomyces indiaensis TaxID=284033 RepID=A0ABN3EJP9_9ACTN
MQHRGAHDPQGHAEPVPGEQAHPRVGGQGERAAEHQQVQGAADDDAISHHRSPNVIRATHLVFSTPGAAGTMIRAG